MGEEDDVDELSSNANCILDFANPGELILLALDTGPAIGAEAVMPPPTTTSTAIVPARRSFLDTLRSMPHWQIAALSIGVAVVFGFGVVALGSKAAVAAAAL
jgi:hypothetical protein